MLPPTTGASSAAGSGDSGGDGAGAGDYDDDDGLDDGLGDTADGLEEQFNDHDFYPLPVIGSS